MAQTNVPEPAIIKEPTGKARKRRGLWADAWLRLRKNTTAVIGMVLLAIILVSCLAAPLYIDYETDVIKVNKQERAKFPAEGKLLGTDELGRDIFARIIWGGRYSLFVGMASVAIAALIGTALGAIAGYYGGKWDSWIMRGLDIFMAIPSMLLMITLVSIMKPTVINLTLAVSVGFIPGKARLIRAQVLKIKDLEYVDAVRALGASDLRVIVSHILPNAVSPIISSFVMSIPGSIMTISGLSFIGLGIQAPDPEWGAMLSSGRAFIRDAWHITAFPGIAIVITIIALTLVGDGLRDALDPRMKD
ncbi:MAG TPA: ABC transporter permease [Firmicutes bacterium]|nr:ABC transporter permease [Candidatus Fermentithermobacillaceae bacterium]